jgi:hypothetical protein
LRTRRRTVTAAICLVTAVGLVAFWAWRRAPHGTVEHFAHWLGDGCLSVDHEEPRVSSDDRKRGLVGTDRLICNNLGGGIEILRFATSEKQQAAAIDPRYRRKTICSIAPEELVVDELLAPDGRSFASWCATLHGQIHDGQARG